MPNTMLTTKPFHPDHLKDLPNVNELAMQIHFNIGPAITIFDPEGDVVAAAGMDTPRKGIGEVWVYKTPLLMRYRFSVIKLLIQMLDRAVKDLEIHRLQAVIREDNTQARRWIKTYGFREEDMTFLKWFDSEKRNYYMYVRYFDGT